MVENVHLMTTLLCMQALNQVFFLKMGSVRYSEKREGEEDVSYLQNDL